MSGKRGLHLVEGEVVSWVWVGQAKQVGAFIEELRGMTEDEAGVVCERVKDYLENTPGFDIGRAEHFEAVVRNVRGQLPNVAEDDLCVVSAMCLLGPGSATGQGLQGTDTVPPADMRRELLAILRRFVPDGLERLRRVMEFVIAHGCGKWRNVQEGDRVWDQRWQGAMQGLARALEPAVEQANRWQTKTVVGFPQGRNVSQNIKFPQDTAVWSDAWMLVMRLVRPEHSLQLEPGETLSVECTGDGTELELFSQDYQKMIPPGAKAVWTVADGDSELTLPDGQSLALLKGAKVIITARDQDALIRVPLNDRSRQVLLKVGEVAKVTGIATLAIWECTCGTTHCLERHRLEKWDPTEMVRRTREILEDGKKKQIEEETPLTLWDFVASAVKGPQFTIQTGSFVQGMYFPLLAQEGFQQ